MWAVVGTESGLNDALFRGQIEAEFGGLALEVDQLPFALLGFVALGANVVIGDLVFEHKVDGARDLVGRSDERLHGADLRPFAAVEGAESGVGAGDGGSGLAYLWQTGGKPARRGCRS
jgi:hypothetical protein